MWMEKYRPEGVDDVVGNDKIIKGVKSQVESGNILNMIFNGPAGVGKTATAIAIAKEIYGDEWKENTMELNASNERGIDVVREKIKDFAKSTTMFDKEYKIIFLDEADALTSDAQAALRTTMERYTDNCRFILSCNYASKIIEPIQSRCLRFNFSKVGNEKVAKRVKEIVEGEGGSITPKAGKRLIRAADGDLRQAMTLAQSAFVLSGGDIEYEHVTSADSSLTREDSMELLKTAISGDFEGGVDKVTEMTIERGLSGSDIVDRLQSDVRRLDVSEKDQIDIFDNLGDVEYRINVGCNPHIQLKSFVAKLCNDDIKKEREDERDKGNEDDEHPFFAGDD